MRSGCLSQISELDDANGGDTHGGAGSYFGIESKKGTPPYH